MKIVICGSRNFSKPEKVVTYVASLPLGTAIIVGDARGVDAKAYESAKRLSLNVQQFKADWDGLGRKAGMVRNIEMLDQHPDMVTAFWDGTSPGTKFMIEECIKRQINFRVYF